jgi:hypothetical protein
LLKIHSEYFIFLASIKEEPREPAIEEHASAPAKAPQREPSQIEEERERQRE